MRIDLNRPMAEIRGQLSALPVKTRVSLTGPLVVARDIAHAKIAERLEAGEPMPAYLRDHPVYYAGPAKTPEGYASGSFGPTTAGRMDSYVEQFQAAGGSLVMLAKGNRSTQVTTACATYGGFYLGSIGGPAARLAQDCIRSVEVLEYPELGMEAVWKIEVEDFPAFVVVDDKGNDFFAETSTPTLQVASGADASASACGGSRPRRVTAADAGPRPRASAAARARSATPDTATPSGPASTGSSTSDRTSGRSSASRFSRSARSSSASSRAGGLAAVAGQQRRRPGLADQLGRVDRRQRQRPVGAVAEQLGGHAGQAERQQRAERRVVEQGEHARRARRAHPLHEHLVAARGAGQVGERLPGTLVGDDHQPHARAVDPVPPLLGGRLDRHGEPELARHGDGLRGAAGPPERQHLDAVAAQQRDPLVVVEHVLDPAARWQRSTSARAPCTSIPAGRTSRRPARVRQRAYRTARPSAATARSGVG